MIDSAVYFNRLYQKNYVVVLNATHSNPKANVQAISARLWTGCSASTTS